MEQIDEEVEEKDPNVDFAAMESKFQSLTNDKLSHQKSLDDSDVISES